MTRLITLSMISLFLMTGLHSQVPKVAVNVFKKDTAFTCVAVDKSGNVFAGTNGKGLFKFDQKTWKDWSGVGTAFSKGNLRQITVSGNNVWVASSGYVFYLGYPDAGNNNNFWGGIHRVDGEFPMYGTYFRGRPVLGQTNPFASGPPSRNVLGVTLDSRGYPWCAASYHDSITYPAFLNYNSRYHFAPGAVGMFNGTNFSFITGAGLPDPTGILIGVGNDYKDESYSIGKRRTCRSVSTAGNEMWVGSDGYQAASGLVTAGILRYDINGNYLGKFDQAGTGVPFGTGNSDFGPWALYEDKSGRVWAAMNGNKGIAVYDTNGWHYIGVPSIISPATIFRANAITGNSEGEVFFGTGSGILIYKGTGAYADPNSYKVYTTQNGLSSNSIFSVAIGPDQSIWAATTAGINQVKRGDLLVYNRKPARAIVTDKDNARRMVINYDSEKSQLELDKETLLISADGSMSTIFKWIGTNPANVRFRFAEDPASFNKDEFGSFAAEFQSIDSARFLYTHPKFVDELYTVSNDGGRIARLQVVDNSTNPVTVLLNVPVKFVLPPVLMVHGVWSSVQSFEKLNTYLLSVSKDYKPYSLLRIWYANDKHPEPETSQLDYRYEVPNGIDKLLENCAVNKMSAGKVDVLAHSRGGIFTRTYLQERYVDYRNDIHKLVTINTPHSGSQQANLTLDKRVISVKKTSLVPPFFVQSSMPLGKVVSGFVLAGQDDIRGAIEMKVDAPAILQELNGSFWLNRNKTFSHAVIGRQVFGSTSFAQVVNSGLLMGNPNLAIRMMANFASFGISTADDMLKSIFDSEFNDIVVPESSQQGGLPDPNTSRFPGINVAHSNKIIVGNQVATGVLEIPLVHDRLMTLLRAKATGQLFTMDGFHPMDLSMRYNFFKPNPWWLSGEARYQQTTQNDVRISIDTALNQRVYAAGDTVTVRISKLNSDTVIIAYSGKSIDVYSDEHFANDTVFRFPIPKDAIGPISIESYAFSNQNVGYDSSTLIVGTRAGVVLDSIKISGGTGNNMLTVTRGDSVTFNVRGYYSDSITREVSFQRPMLFSMLAGNAAAAQPNKVKGITVGFDLLTVEFQGKKDSIKVEVVPLITLPPSQISLPVKFQGLTAVYKGDRVQVNWNTAMELNNRHFEIEHSSNGYLFEKAGTVAASNNGNGSSYLFNHYGYLAGKNYYRIRQLDLDGRSSYSAVALVIVSAKNEFVLYPNPANRKVSINFNTPNTNVKTIRILNRSGQVMTRQVVAPEITKIELDVSSFAPGSYSVELLNTDNKTINTTSFIKN